MGDNSGKTLMAQLGLVILAMALLVLSMALSGCGGDNAQSVAATVEYLQAATAVPAPTQEPTATAEPTATMEPTATAEPTQTATPEPTATPELDRLGNTQLYAMDASSYMQALGDYFDYSGQVVTQLAVGNRDDGMIKRLQEYQDEYVAYADVLQGYDRETLTDGGQELYDAMEEVSANCIPLVTISSLTMGDYNDGEIDMEEFISGMDLAMVFQDDCLGAIDEAGDVAERNTR